MGERTNYTIITTDNPSQNINVYSHWDGPQSLTILRDALRVAENRIGIGDMTYSTRIIISQVTRYGYEPELGYGVYVGTDMHEEAYDVKVVNLIDKTVSVNDKIYTIREFIQIEDFGESKYD